jgi:pullulanase
LLFLFAAVFFITLLAPVVKAESAPTKLIIHYYRYDANYSNWDMWLWPSAPRNEGGALYNFDKVGTELVMDDWGAVATINLSASNAHLTGLNRIGIILRRGTWDIRDLNNDRFIDIPTTTTNGEVHAYFVQGDQRIGYSPTDPNGPDKSDKILNTYFSTVNTIRFFLTRTVPTTDVTLKVNDVVTTGTVNISGTSGTLTLSSGVDLTKKYELSVKFNNDNTKTSRVNFDGIYDSSEFEAAYGYEGDDLGVTYSQTSSTFKVWGPISDQMDLLIYTTGSPAYVSEGTNTPTQTVPMVRGDKGVWSATVTGDLHGKYYTYRVTNGSSIHEVIDPYAQSSGVNGHRGMIVDFSRTNPQGWNYENRLYNIANPTDAILYELHIRDLTTHSSWTGNNAYRGKFLGLTQRGTTYNGVTTGLDHIIELGITHLHLLPVFDFGVVDETRLSDPTYVNAKPGIFNWGYMPLNFNVVEGSYSTNPFDGEVRVNEFKQMIQTLNDNDINVVMDVVYNHTGPSADSNFNLLVPGYYFRFNSDGSFSNGSGTGNETASERYMMRKFMIDSVKFWAAEYKIGGFRFDLMALHDYTTMNLLAEALHEIDPTIIIYGEPWTGGTSPLPDAQRAGKTNIINMPNVAAFSDDTRDGIKGSVFNNPDKGFVQGNSSPAFIQKVRYAVAGGVNHPQINASVGGLGEGKGIWHGEPNRIINYVSAHDNHTLHDKLRLSVGNDMEKIIPMQKQANAIVLTSQGIPFLHAGVEFLRSKPAASGTGYDHNSYESPDSVNQLRWDLKAREANMGVFHYYKGMIALRKAHPAFRMTSSQDIIANLEFVLTDQADLVAYTIRNNANGDTWDNILVIHNGAKEMRYVNLTGDLAGGWNVVANLSNAGTTVLKTVEDGGRVRLFENETLILYQGLTLPDDGNNGFPTLVFLIAGASTLGLGGIGAIVFLLLKRRKL